MQEEEIQSVSKIFRALGNDVRVRILLLVSETRKPLHIKAMPNALKMDYDALYRHIKVLQNSGLLDVYDVGCSLIVYLKHKELIEKVIETAKKILE